MHGCSGTFRFRLHANTLLLLCLVAVRSCHALTVAVDGKQVVKELLELATFTDDPNPAVTRILFTPNDMRARKYVKGLMTAAGLAVREDPMGNIFGRLDGTQKTGAVVTGSHCDAIPLAGAYDGTTGVIGGIAALAALSKAGFKPCRPLDVMMFTSEEPTRFGLGCIGSRGMAGVLTPQLLDEKVDINGTAFLEAANKAGYGGKSHKDMLARTKVAPGEIDYFVELHIEQGPLLEREQLQIGVVTAIAAPATLRVRFSGDGGHAGALLMPDRNDAGLAAAELALAVEKHVLDTGAVDTVGTAGLVELEPNAVNSVPREAKLEIDVRDIDGNRRDRVLEKIHASIREIAARRNVRYSVETINQDPPATCGQKVVDSVLASVKERGYSHKQMVSRAYHDSLFMAQIAPTGMIFIPCRGGYSHRPDEFASPADIARGVEVLALSMAKLSCDEMPAGHTEL